MAYSFLKRRCISSRDHLVGYLNSYLGDYFRITSNRYLDYLLVTLIAGAWTFFGLTLPHFTKPWSVIHLEIFRWTHVITHSEMFRWSYTAESALNFGLSYYFFSEWVCRAIGKWGRFENRAVGKTCLIWSVAFLFAFILQLTFIYSRVDVYYPRLVNFLDIYPVVRPGVVYVFLFYFPAWLITVYLLTWMGLKRQLALESERAEFDHTLKLREQKWAAKYQALKTNAVFSSSEPAHRDSFTREPIRIPDSNGSRWINPEQISHIMVEDHYCRISFKDHNSDKEVWIKRPLKTLLAQLPEGLFLQIHRSHAINLSYISRIKRDGRSLKLFLNNGSHALPVSRYRLPQILPYLQVYLSPTSGMRSRSSESN